MVDDGFRYPMMLTGLGQLASTLSGWLVAKAGLMSLGPPPALSFYLTRLMPVVVCTAGTLYLGNVSYLSLSVAFIQILKVLTPAITLSVCLVFGLERLTWPLFLSVSLITVGTGIATVVETGVPGFSWSGFTSFVASAFLEAIRVVLIQLLLGRLKYNAVEVLVFLGPPTAALLLAGAYIWEWEGLTHGGFQLMQRSPLLYLLAIFTGFAVNITTAFAIKTTSSLTFKCFGVLKNSAVVAFGIVYGDLVTMSQMLGYMLSVAGFGLYTHHKWVQSQKEAALRKSAKKAQ
ncbi:hypothetical protein WJX72_007680 [[Myrmecia] bisecta]|uniref:Sugar phosphate transporter domain-containing protein n=1 Tax=[Myrmecia] bisecta TaxID=41462 RepID=A0AAW1R873_9CHLO